MDEFGESPSETGNDMSGINTDTTTGAETATDIGGGSLGDASADGGGDLNSGMNADIGGGVATETAVADNGDLGDASAADSGDLDGGKNADGNSGIDAENADNGDLGDASAADSGDLDGDKNADGNSGIDAENADNGDLGDASAADSGDLDGGKNADGNSDIDAKNADNGDLGDASAADSGDLDGSKNADGNSDIDADNGDSTDATETDSDSDFEIGGHRNMTLEEVQEYQQKGQEQIDHDRGTFEPGATMSHEEFLKEQEKFENEITGEHDWPDNDGFEGTPTERNLEAGEEFTRRSHSGTVNDDGNFAGEKDIGFEESALPGEEEDYDVTDYEVTEDMPDSIVVQEGTAQEAFGHEGGGAQYKFQEKILDSQGEQMTGEDGEPSYRDVSIQDMKDYGYINKK